MKHEDMKHEEGDLGLLVAPGTYTQWEQQVPIEIRSDTVWRIEAYRLGLYLGDLVWHDGREIVCDRTMYDVADQLRRAARRISACIAEGYSRDTGKGRSVFYEYALGSARETRDWYYKARSCLKPPVVQHRMDLCTQICRLAITMVANERRRNRRPSDKTSHEHEVS